MENVRLVGARFEQFYGSKVLTMIKLQNMK